MNTNKGIVFETTSAYSIFLTSDGLFEKGIPLSSSIQIGEEVSFRPYQTVKQQQRKASVRTLWATPTLAIVAALVLLFAVLLPAQSNVSAYVQLDINPSIELGINNAGDVYVFKGLNDDGTAIKRDISFWKGKSLSWVLLQIVDRTESLIEKTETIEITTIYQNEADHGSLEKVIETAVITSTSQVMQKKQAIKVIEATVSDWKAANNEGISVQKYQEKLKVKNKNLQQKVKDKVKAKTQKNETKKNQNKSNVIEKDLQEKKELKNEVKQPRNESIKNDQPKNTDIQEKQKVNQNIHKKEQPKVKSKEQPKVNHHNNKIVQAKENPKVTQQKNLKNIATDNKGTNQKIVKKDQKVNGHEKKITKQNKVKKEIKKEKVIPENSSKTMNKDREKGNAKHKD
ncbi:hypothetical protein ACFPYN_01580 [Paenisporosarcina macmurdoensis]|uniref:RsgI N-terminal anti-sigma domain-containing protein n=1 Tax=Paenisporosarcina macmurdoensis TaxID=212659 RepID=A0ABW1L4P4_9BACL